MITDVSKYIATYSKVQVPYVLVGILRSLDAIAEVRNLLNKHVTIQETLDQNGRLKGSLVTVDQNILGSEMCLPNRS
jgi:hypothetical protein